MRSNPLIVASLTCVLSLLGVPLAAQQNPPWTLRGSAVHTLQSAEGHSYEIAVALPHAYQTRGARYPVLFVLDGDAMFPMAAYLAATLNWLYARDLIVVGIGPKQNSMQIRARDLTPTLAPEPEAMCQLPGNGPLTGGGAAAFLTFIQQRVIPFIESNYRTEPKDRGIFGHSYGGLFALYTVFHAPDTFSRYIVSSPSLWWDQRVTLRFEEEYARTHKDLSIDLFLSNGELEESAKEPCWIPLSMVTNSAALDKQLRARKYPTLRLQTHVFEDEHHTTVIPLAFSRGVRALYPK